MSKYTPGAVRAERRIKEVFAEGTLYEGNMAEIIDEETAAPDTLSALETIRDSQALQATVDIAKAAIEKIKGEA